MFLKSVLFDKAPAKYFFKLICNFQLNIKIPPLPKKKLVPVLKNKLRRGNFILWESGDIVCGTTLCIILSNQFVMKLFFRLFHYRHANFMPPEF